MAKQILVFCDHYQREIEHLNFSERYPDVQFIFFKGPCGQPPLKWEKLKRRLLSNQDYDLLNVITGGCIKEIPAENQNALIYNQRHFYQCLNLIVNPALVDYYQQQGCFLVTPGWLQEWPEILEQWGFDRQTAPDFFHESAQKILMLDTMIDEEASLALHKFGSYINLPYESVKIGLDYLELFICNIIQKNQLTADKAQQMAARDSDQKELANFSMTLELLNTLTRLRSEGDVIAAIKEMFKMLFAPREVIFRRASDLEAVSRSTAIRQNPSGFTLPIWGGSEFLGEIELVGFDLPQHREKYFNLATRIVNICGMAIENAMQYKTIKDLSNTDGLTKIANRRRLDHYLQNEWLRMKREKAPLALIMVDIDYFKFYNDSYGHLAGDDCLKTVAKVLSEHIHRPADLVARFGGEEFAVVLPHTDLKGASIVASKIKEAVENKRIIHENSPVSDFVTVSLGVTATIPENNINLEDLLSAADKLLYRAKEEGRNRVASAPLKNLPDQET